MRIALDIIAPWILTAVFWLAFGACVDQPASGPPPIARIIANWDPLACGPPHRVVLELEDDAHVTLVSSTACNTGMLALDTRHMGTYHGRIYATELDPQPVDLYVDEGLYQWWLGSPP